MLITLIESGTLLLFAAVNVAALFYRRAFSLGAAIYLAALILMYADYLFWGVLRSAAMLLYCLATGYLVIKEKRFVLLYLALVNLFHCYEVIPYSAGGYGELTLGMFFEPDADIRLSRTINRFASASLLFMGTGMPVFVFLRLFAHFRAKRGK